MGQTFSGITVFLLYICNDGVRVSNILTKGMMMQCCQCPAALLFVFFSLSIFFCFLFNIRYVCCRLVFGFFLVRQIDEMLQWLVVVSEIVVFIIIILLLLLFNDDWTFKMLLFFEWLTGCLSDSSVILVRNINCFTAFGSLTKLKIDNVFWLFCCFSSYYVLYLHFSNNVTSRLSYVKFIKMCVATLLLFLGSL